MQEKCPRCHACAAPHHEHGSRLWVHQRGEVPEHALQARILGFAGRDDFATHMKISHARVQF